MIGILPTLARDDLVSANLSDGGPLHAAQRPDRRRPRRGLHPRHRRGGAARSAPRRRSRPRPPAPPCSCTSRSRRPGSPTCGTPRRRWPPRRSPSAPTRRSCSGASCGASRGHRCSSRPPTPGRPSSRPRAYGRAPGSGSGGSTRRTSSSRRTCATSRPCCRSATTRIRCGCSTTGGVPGLAGARPAQRHRLPLEPARLRRRRRRAAPAGGEPGAAGRADGHRRRSPTPPSTTGSCAPSPRSRGPVWTPAAVRGRRRELRRGLPVRHRRAARSGRAGAGTAGVGRGARRAARTGRAAAAGRGGAGRLGRRARRPGPLPRRDRGALPAAGQRGVLAGRTRTTGRWQAGLARDAALAATTRRYGELMHSGRPGAHLAGRAAGGGERRPSALTGRTGRPSSCAPRRGPAVPSGPPPPGDCQCRLRSPPRRSDLPARRGGSMGWRRDGRTGVGRAGGAGAGCPWASEAGRRILRDRDAARARALAGRERGVGADQLRRLGHQAGRAEGPGGHAQRLVRAGPALARPRLAAVRHHHRAGARRCWSRTSCCARARGLRALGFDRTRPVARPRPGRGRSRRGSAAPGSPSIWRPAASGFNLTVVPEALPDVWWKYPVLILSAIQNSVLEEVIVVGVSAAPARPVGLVADGARWLASSVLRGSYHLYQGIGGFIGNMVMGVVFVYLYRRWGRVGRSWSPTRCSTSWRSSGTRCWRARWAGCPRRERRTCGDGDRAVRPACSLCVGSGRR